MKNGTHHVNNYGPPNRQAAPAAQEALAAVKAALGVTPNLYRAAANSPAALNALIQMGGALAKRRLRAKPRESLALAVAQGNGCGDCRSAHSLLGRAAGFDDTDTASAREGSATDAYANAILGLARNIVRHQGRIEPDALTCAKAAGVSEAEVVEIVADAGCGRTLQDAAPGAVSSGPA